MLRSWPEDRSSMLSCWAVVSVMGQAVPGRFDFVFPPGTWNSSCLEDRGLNDHVWSGTLNTWLAKQSERETQEWVKEEDLRTEWLRGLSSCPLSTRDKKGWTWSEKSTGGHQALLWKFHAILPLAENAPNLHSLSHYFSLIVIELVSQICCQMPRIEGRSIRGGSWVGARKASQRTSGLIHHSRQYTFRLFL